MAIELANHIYRDGEGVPVVLMNAYPVDHRMWDVCAKALADFADLNDVPDFPIWAPDMAGSGASPVPSDRRFGPPHGERRVQRGVGSPGRSLRGPDQGRRL